MSQTGTSRYAETYARWRNDPSAFWGEAARDIDWIKPADTVFDPDAGIYGRWFSGASANTCHNAVDRHVAAGRGAQAANPACRRPRSAAVRGPRVHSRKSQEG